jgi:hypothetical protein
MNVRRRPLAQIAKAPKVYNFAPHGAVHLDNERRVGREAQRSLLWLRVQFARSQAKACGHVSIGSRVVRIIDSLLRLIATHVVVVSAKLWTLVG